MSTFDLNNPPQDHKVSVSVESKETRGERYVVVSVMMVIVEEIALLWKW